MPVTNSVALNGSKAQMSLIHAALEILTATAGFWPGRKNPIRMACNLGKLRWDVTQICVSKRKARAWKTSGAPER